MKKGDLIFIKCNIGLLHISGYKGHILRVNKKDSIIKSIRVNVIESFSIKDGISNQEFQRTFYIENEKVYAIFDNRASFVSSICSAIRNVRQILNTSEAEVSGSFL